MFGSPLVSWLLDQSHAELTALACLLEFLQDKHCLGTQMLTKSTTLATLNFVKAVISPDFLNPNAQFDSPTLLWWRPRWRNKHSGSETLTWGNKPVCVQTPWLIQGKKIIFSEVLGTHSDAEKNKGGVIPNQDQENEIIVRWSGDKKTHWAGRDVLRKNQTIDQYGNEILYLLITHRTGDSCSDDLIPCPSSTQIKMSFRLIFKSHKWCLQ